MKIAMFGASGKLGQILLRETLNQGHTVTALTRAADKLSGFAGQVDVIVGDYLDADARQKTLTSADAVLTTIGPPLKRAPNSGEYAKAMTGLIQQIQSTGIRRIIAVGGAGLRLGGEPLPFPRAVMRQILRLTGGRGYADKEKEHNVLFDSDLDWTILRPPQIASAQGSFIVSPDRPAAFKVDPEDVARHMVAILDDQQSFKTAPFIATA